jgi:nucleoside-diphosphate-sugar epimerase
MKKTILVTGAAGFIGSHLCEALLKEGYEVLGIDNFDPFYSREEKEKNLKISLRSAGFRFFEGDAGDEALLNSLPGRVDIIVHLAAKAGVLTSLKNPQEYIKTNIGVTNSLLEWMRQKQVRKMVFASSSSVYGNNASIPFNESDSANEPISPYAFTKRSCELMNHAYHSLYGLDIINLRFFTVYGERQRPDLAIRKFVKAIFEERPITIYGDGKTARDYTYYTDTVTGILSAVRYIEQNNGVLETFNLGNNQPVQLIDLVNTIGHAAGVKPLISYEDMKPGDVNITFANIDKAAQVLDYAPQTTLASGIGKFIQWYKNSFVKELS